MHVLRNEAFHSRVSGTKFRHLSSLQKYLMKRALNMSWSMFLQSGDQEGKSSISGGVAPRRQMTSKICVDLIQLSVISRIIL